MTCPNCDPCEACYGMGAIAVHAPTCHSDLCVMAGGYYDCNGNYEPCEECNGAGVIHPAMQREAEYRACLAYVISELSDSLGVDRRQLIARCEQVLSANASATPTAARQAATGGGL